MVHAYRNGGVDILISNIGVQGCKLQCRALLAHPNGHVSLPLTMHVLILLAHADHTPQLIYKWLQAEEYGAPRLEALAFKLYSISLSSKCSLVYVSHHHDTSPDIVQLTYQGWCHGDLKHIQLTCQPPTIGLTSSDMSQIAIVRTVFIHLTAFAP